MSLLNQMLTDLESRRRDADGSPLPNLTSAAVPPTRLRPTVLAGLGGLVLLSGLAYWYFLVPAVPATNPAAPVPGQAPVPGPASASGPVVSQTATPPPGASPATAASTASAAVPATSTTASTAAPASAAPVAAATPAATAAAPTTRPAPPAATSGTVTRPSEPSASAQPRPDSTGSVPAIVAPSPAQPPDKSARNAPPAAAPAFQGVARKTESPQQKADFLYRQGLHTLQHGRQQDAVPLLLQAVRTHPDGLEARQTLAVTLMMQGLNNEAEPVLRDGLQRSPGHPALSQLLGRLQLERGQLPQAQGTLERALAGANGDAQLHSLLALVHQRQGQHPQASAQFLAALRSDPSMPGWLTGLATSWEAMGMRAEAREALERALQSGRMSEDLEAFARKKLAQPN
jgi:MSHA biogenesis protein MshN